MTIKSPGFVIPHYKPVIVSSASVSLAENQNIVLSIVAVDPDARATITYSIVGGTDQALFSINSGNGSLAFTVAPNFESPTDSNADNIYQVIVRATSQGETVDQTIAVTITNVNEAPVFTSSATVSVAENQTSVITVHANDPEGLTVTYTIVGGADSAKFSVNSSSGVLTFNTAPNFEAPTDVGGNNVYDVTVRASDGTVTADQAIVVTVTNANEAPTSVSLSASTLAENSAQGTFIGTLSFTDPDAGATGTFSLTNSAGSRFQITGTSLQAGSVSTDFETATSHLITVRFTDQGGLTFDQNFTINISNVNEVTPGSSSFTAGQSGTFVVPAFNTMTVDLRGGGAGGNAISTPGGSVAAATAGQATTVSTLGLSAGGGGAGSGNTGGAAGVASGGNNINTNGNAGGSVAGVVASNTNTGAGAAAPNGGAQVGPTVVTPTGVGANHPGINGNSTGGGGEGNGKGNGSTIAQGMPGGGSGAFVRSIYSAGAISVGASLSYAVAAAVAGGNAGAGSTGGTGAGGALSFTWS